MQIKGTSFIYYHSIELYASLGFAEPKQYSKKIWAFQRSISFTKRRYTSLALTNSTSNIEEKRITSTATECAQFTEHSARDWDGIAAAGVTDTASTSATGNECWRGHGSAMNFGTLSPGIITGKLWTFSFLFSCKSTRRVNEWVSEWVKEQEVDLTGSPDYWSRAEHNKSYSQIQSVYKTRACLHDFFAGFQSHSQVAFGVPKLLLLDGEIYLGSFKGEQMLISFHSFTKSLKGHFDASPPDNVNYGSLSILF